MKPVSITWARDVGKRGNAKAVVVIMTDGETWSVTTWGRTRKECDALRDYAESGGFDQIAMDIAEIVE